MRVHNTRCLCSDTLERPPALCSVSVTGNEGCESLQVTHPQFPSAPATDPCVQPSEGTAGSAPHSHVPLTFISSLVFILPLHLLVFLLSPSVRSSFRRCCPCLARSREHSLYELCSELWKNSASLLIPFDCGSSRGAGEEEALGRPSST